MIQKYSETLKIAFVTFINVVDDNMKMCTGGNENFVLEWTKYDTYYWKFHSEKIQSILLI